jgi:hypothetical protein
VGQPVQLGVETVADLSEYSIADLAKLVGAEPPGTYDSDASYCATRIGLAVHRARRDLRLLCVFRTDHVQPSAATVRPAAVPSARDGLHR